MGARFHLVNPTANFSSVAFCAAIPSQGYGLTGTGVERTLDGGKTWQPTAPLSGHPSLVAVDPEDASIAYVGFSYPLGLDITTDGGRHWRSVLAAYGVTQQRRLFSQRILPDVSTMYRRRGCIHTLNPSVVSAPRHWFTHTV